MHRFPALLVKPNFQAMTHSKRFIFAASILAVVFSANIAFSATDPAKAKVFDDVIVPVLSAKCYDCHGANKDKGKLRLHTKESFLKGGKEAGAKIIVKGKLDDSELYYRISLPNDDDDVMPPFDEDEPHNPVTAEELKVFAAWILSGASFDAKGTSSRKPPFPQHENCHPFFEERQIFLKVVFTRQME
jgi:mono/diheme cytochrome c family protein